MKLYHQYNIYPYIGNGSNKKNSNDDSRELIVYTDTQRRRYGDFSFFLWTFPLFSFYAFDSLVIYGCCYYYHCTLLFHTLIHKGESWPSVGLLLLLAARLPLHLEALNFPSCMIIIDCSTRFHTLK